MIGNELTPPAKPRGGEIKALTGLRGIAAVLVMIYHFEWSIQVSGPFTAFINHGYLCVDLFFVLSGFVMATAYGPRFGNGWDWPQYRTFLTHRIARVYPLYAFTVVCIMIAYRIGLYHFPPPPPPSLLATNLLMIQAWLNDDSINGPTWSISTEWAAYLVFPLLFAVTNRVGRGWAMTVGCACFAAIAAIIVLASVGSFGVRLKGPLDVAAGWAAVLRCLAGFMLGLLAWRLARHPRTAALLGRRWIAAAVTGLALVLLCVPRSDAALYLLLAPLVLVLAVGAGRVVGFLESRPIYLLGLLSYGIYLLHERAQGVWNAIAGLTPGLHPILQHLIATTATGLLVLAAAWLCYLAIEVPARRWLRQALEPRGAAPALP